MKGLALLIALAVIAAACGSTAAAPSASPTRLATAIRTAPPTPPPAPPACVVKPVTFVKAPSKAVITLVKGGTITIALRPDKAPNTVTNFANVALSGCYDGLTFHRVVANFVAQGGDPEGTGNGGGEQRTELSELPFIKGAVGIARKPTPVEISNAFQFFICTGDCLNLNNQYTNFGQVISGQDVANKIAIGDKIKTITVE